jgi:hypothetical protein
MVLLTEAPYGGWGLNGHANTNEELVAAARAQIAQACKPASPRIRDGAKRCEARRA